MGTAAHLWPKAKRLQPGWTHAAFQGQPGSALRAASASFG
jgi:hypothetical protein